MADEENLGPPAGAGHRFGGQDIDPAVTRLIVGLGLVGLLLLIAIARQPMLDPADLPLSRSELPSPVMLVKVEDSAGMISYLHEQGLWDLDDSGYLSPVIFASFPHDIADLNDTDRKRMFLHALAPTALVALAEVSQERAELLKIIDRMDLESCTLDQLLDGALEHNQCGLSRAEVDFLEELSAKYRTDHLKVLLNRVDVVPLSLVLAQAAMESSWGASRFALEGNNVFGIWTWGQHGMVPANREQGMTHRVAIYDSLLDSVRSYLLMLNRVGAYRTLREIRRESRDPLDLVNGLKYYSEKRDEYVADLDRLIRVNQLQRYDNLTLALPPQQVLDQFDSEPVIVTRRDL